MQVNKNADYNTVMFNNPLVSIYIPTKNRLDLLKRAVGSAVNQSYRNIEIIIVDDGSTDGTWSYLIELKNKVNNIIIHKNYESLGACVSRNIAINLAKGEFITGLDDDDYILDKHIESLITTWFDCGKKICAVYPGTIVKTKKNKLKVIRKKTDTSCESLLIQNTIGNQVLTKTESLKMIGGFDIALKAWQDIECWYRLLKKFDQVAVYSGRDTYIADQSHMHERISDNKIDGVNQAYDHFCLKHALTNNKRLMLSMHKIQYGITKNALKNCFYLTFSDIIAESRSKAIVYAARATLIQIKRHLKI
jgi:glycosyltransferase involved in cell wall biosynthesis